MEKSILLKKCVVTCFFLRMMKTTANNVLFGIKRNVFLAFFIAFSFCSNVFAQDPCPPDSPDFDIVNPTHSEDCTILTGDCTSKDLYVLDAFLVAENECNSCDGTEPITAQLWLTLVNDTGSTRTSFAIFGTINTYDDKGALTGSCSISRCIETIEKNSSTPRYYGDIEYTCGDNLKLVDVIQSWTDAGKPSTCPNHDCAEISPKCGFSSEIEIKPPLQASATAECKSASTIDIDLTVQGGSGSYSYDWTKEGGGFSSSVEDPSGVSPGKYYVTVTDNSIVDGNGVNCVVMTDVTLDTCCTDADAGTDGNTTVCDSSVAVIDLFGLITGEEIGGTWTRLTGSSGTFSAGAGTYTPASGATTSTFKYTLIGAEPCKGDESIATVTIELAKDPGTDGNLTICSSESLTEEMLFASLGGNPDVGGVWSPALGGAGDYTYTFSATSECPEVSAKVTLSIEEEKDPGTDGNLTICSSESLTEGMLFVALGGNPDVGGVWSPALGGAGDYTYTFSATSECPEVSAKVTLSIEEEKDPGTDGNLTICSSESLTEEMLFASLGGNPDVGGVWSPALGGAGDYTYTFSATSECPEVSAKVTLSIEEEKDPGTDGNLTICSSESLTEGMLFAALGGNPDVGGVWSPALGGAGDYTYTFSATSECPEVSAKVTLSIEEEKDSGTDGTLTICSSESLTEEMLFASLGGNPDVGGVWSPALGGAGDYTYTFSATSECPEVSAKVTLSIEEEKDPGTDGNLTICSSESLTEGMLFVALGGNPDVGGVWSPALGGAGDYTYTFSATSECPEVSAKVTLSIEEEKDPGTDGNLTICSSESLTEGMLFVALGGNPDVGGVWSPALGGAGDYTYTFSATNECPEVSAKVALSIEEEKDPGSDGNLIICFGDIVTADELFSSLNGNPNSGGIWSPLPLGGAGNYTYTFAATSICPEVSSDVVVAEQSEITSAIQRTDATCFNGSDGKLNLTVSGGTPPYTFLWSNGAKTEDIKDLTAGLYSVRITDARECTTENSERVGEPDKLRAKISCGHITCHSDVNGTLDLTVTGGTPPYTYLWNTGDTDEDLSGLPGGIYTVTVTDANDCTVEQSTVITQPDLLYCNIVQDNPCSSNGGNDGGATVTASGGRTPYTYLWDNGETTAAATSLTAGVHVVTVTDALNCQTTCEITITEPDILICSVELNNHVLCKGDSSGSATVNASDGAAPYTYLWDNGETTQTAVSLNPGLHSVTVTDAYQVITSCTIMITEPDILEATAIGGSVISCSCYGGSDGSIDLTVIGGTPDYTYLWSNGATTEDLSGLLAGTYSVIVTDSNGCTTEEEIIISEPGMLSCEITQDSPASAHDANDGVATVTPSGGTSPYTYLWDNNETTAQAISLNVGTHSVTVTDYFGCYTTCDVIIECLPNVLRCDVTKNSDVNCYEGEDGSAKVIAEGGVPPYKYLWDNGEVTQTATSLTEGLHTVTVTDASQSETTCDVTIDEPLMLEASAEAEGATTYCSCYGGSDGSIDLTVIGGTPDYTYLWSNGATTEDLSGLLAGTYSVIVTDSNGCTTEEEIIISEPGMLSCEITQDSPASAHDANDGVATVTPSGGTSPYTYLWDNNETTAQAISLNVGTHSVTVTDYFGCYTTCDVIIECLPNVLRCDVTKNSDVNCYEGEDGSAKVIAEGGVPPYKYLWDNGEVTQTTTSLTEGLHTVTVTDASQSETTCDVTIDEPLMLEASAEAEGATTYCSCYGASDGSIDLTVTGGTPEYTYLWSPGGETTEDISGLSAGTYSVIVTDSNGCTTEEEVVVGEPGLLSCDIVEYSHVSINGGSDGEAAVSVEGGTPAYSYLWSPGGATTAQSTGLSAGVYTVTVTDYFGCETTCEVIITEPNPEEPRASCSYTQGFYGNPGGLACIPDSQQVNAKYIMLGALNASGGKFDFGDKNTGKYYSLFLGDIQNDNIFKMLPGGGPSNKLQGYATYDLIATWNNVPLVDKGPRRGKIKNNLLSQTMTLYFNLHADDLLGNHQLKENFYTAATKECGSEEYLANSVEHFKISGDVISYLNTNNSNTVQGLFKLANDALGGHDIGSLSYSNITEAVDVINNAFDECRVLVSEIVYDKVVAGLTDDKPIFTIYPVPFVDTVKIKYKIDSDSEATIQVFDIRGRLVKSIIDEDVYYHKVTELNLDYRTFANQVYFIKVSTRDKSTMKKIISVR